MTKEQWLEHMESDGLVAPSKGGDVKAWVKACHQHRESVCRMCQLRSRTLRANRRSKAMRSVYADLGMVRVKGNLGGTYYE
jgi:N-methylhydantoinase B/oxoprolinase/acetone carboxylase alpha subunit